MKEEFLIGEFLICDNKIIKFKSIEINTTKFYYEILKIANHYKYLKYYFKLIDVTYENTGITTNFAEIEYKFNLYLMEDNYCVFFDSKSQNYIIIKDLSSHFIIIVMSFASKADLIDILSE